MCEMCGCGTVKAVARLAGANGVPVTLAVIPVRMVEPRAKDTVPARQRQYGAEVPLLRREPQTALRD